jgi:hypothetical protein
LPKIVCFFLRRAIDDQRQGFVELEICWTAVEGRELLAVQLKFTIMTVPAGSGPAEP